MSNIKPGDLVVITRHASCCKTNACLGRIFTVRAVGRFSGNCHVCGTYHDVVAAKFEEVNGACELHRLTRIDPLPESETQDNHESLTA